MEPIRKKENRISFSVGVATALEISDIIGYYQEPVQKLIFDDLLLAIKKKHETVPLQYRTKK